MKPLLTLAPHERAYISFFVDQFPEDMTMLQKVVPTLDKITLVFGAGDDVRLTVLDRASIPNPFKDSVAVAVERFVTDSQYAPATP